jgi:hypothetical protein
MSAPRAQIDWKADARRIVLEKFLAAAARLEKTYREKFPKASSLANAVANESPVVGDLLYALEEARERGLDAPPPPAQPERR